MIMSLRHNNRMSRADALSAASSTLNAWCHGAAFEPITFATIRRIACTSYNHRYHPRQSRM
jgi:hypothetical protein